MQTTILFGVFLPHHIELVIIINIAEVERFFSRFVWDFNMCSATHDGRKMLNFYAHTISVRIYRANREIVEIVI